MAKVLLLGGTGAMGGHLRCKLAKMGYDVFVTSRSSRQQEENISFVVGNAKDNSFLHQLLVEIKPDAIVDFMNYGTIEFMNRRDMMLNATGQYLYLSSCRVFAGEEKHTEQSPRLLDVSNDSVYLKTDEYALAKARQENLLRESGRNNWTIIRPCIIYSSPRFQFGCLESGTFMVRALQGLPAVIPNEMLDKNTTMMWGGDAAKMIARLVLNKKALGEDFNAVTAENHTWREVGSIYHDLIGLDIKECSLEEYLNMCNPWQVKYGRMKHHSFDNLKILDITGLKQEEFMNLKTGLAIEIEKFKSMPDIDIDIYNNAFIDRMLGTRIKGIEKKKYLFARYPMLARIQYAISLGIRSIKK